MGATRAAWRWGAGGGSCTTEGKGTAGRSLNVCWPPCSLPSKSLHAHISFLACLPHYLFQPSCHRPFYKESHLPLEICRLLLSFKAQIQMQFELVASSVARAPGGRMDRRIRRVGGGMEESKGQGGSDPNQIES